MDSISINSQLFLWHHQFLLNFTVGSMSSPRLEQLRIRQLKFVGLLASLGSLAATAERLSMTPSAASMMLKEIESIFGAKLFFRQGRGMALTEQGRALLPRCQTVMGEIGAMGASLQEASQPLLRIGAFPHTTATVLPKIINCLTTGDVSWRVQIYDYGAERLFDLLTAGELDLLLGRLPSKAVNDHAIADLDQLLLYQSTLAVVAGRQHPLSGRTDLSMSDLLAWPWVLPSIQSTTRVALVDAFLRQGLAPPVPVVESPSFFYSLSLIAHADLLTCCVRSAAVAHSNQNVILPVEMNMHPSPIALVWRKNSAEARRAVAKLTQFVSGEQSRVN
jgi:DNA-binding transcriptional LysR family regulator